MPKTIVLPPGTQKPIAPFSPGTLADGVVYVSGTLAFDKDNNVAHVGDCEAQRRANRHLRLGCASVCFGGRSWHHNLRVRSGE